MNNSVDQKVYEEQTQLLFENARISNIVVLIVIGMMTSILHGQVTNVVLFTWSICGVVLTALRIVTLLWRDHKSHTITSVKWVRIYGLLTALLSLCWAWLAYMGYGITLSLDLITLIVIIGLAALAVPALVSFPAIAIIYFAPAGIVITVEFLIDTELEKILIGVAMLAFNFMIIRSTFNFHSVLKESLLLRFKNAELNAQLENEISDRKKIETELKRLAMHDPLTNVYNRQALQEHAIREFARAERHSHPISVFMIDIDHFKTINDSYGHAAGDKVLTAFANILSESTRSVDIVARYGGEEFVVLLPELASEAAIQMAERVRLQIEKQPLSIRKNTDIKITASIGVATSLNNHLAFETILKHADDALYSAKMQGRNRVQAHLPDH